MLSSNVSDVLYIIHFLRNFPFKRQLALILQFHDDMVLLKLALFFHHSLIMLRDKVCHVRHIAVTQFNIIVVDFTDLV